MKKSILLLFAFVCSFSFCFAQSTQFVRSYGYLTEGYEITSLSNNQWVVAMVSKPSWGAIFQDTVTALIFESNGNILHEIHLQLPPSEEYTVTDLIGLPNGGFALVVALNSCVEDLKIRYISVYNENGVFLWGRQIDGILSKLRISPDGYLCGIVNRTLEPNELKAFDLETGTILWSKILNSGNTPVTITSFDFFDNGNYFFATNIATYQCWKKVQSDTFDLINFYQIVDPNYGPKKILFDSATNRFLILGIFGTFLELDPLTMNFNVLGYQGYATIDLVATDSNFISIGLYTINYVDGHLQTTGLIQNYYHGSIKCKKATIKDHHLALVGLTKSHNGVFATTALWVLVKDLNLGPETDISTQDVTLENIYEAEPIDIDTTLLSNNTYEYAIKGGRFKFKIRNKGTSPIHSINIYAKHDPYTGGDCPFLEKSYCAYISDFTINPGEVGFVEMNQPLVEHQITYPNKFCFLINHPNSLLDKDISFNTKCYYLDHSATNEMAPIQLQLSPTIVTDQLKIASGENAKFIRISDISGITILEQTQYQDFIDVGSLPQGLYVISALIENRWHTGKFVKQ